MLRLQVIDAQWKQLSQSRRWMMDASAWNLIGLLPSLRPEGTPRGHLRSHEETWMELATAGAD